MKQISALLRYVLLTIGVCVSSNCWAQDDEVAFDWAGTYVVAGEVASMTDAMDYQATSFGMEDLPTDGEAEQQPIIESITSRPATLDDYQNVLLMSSLGEWESGYQQVNNYGSYLYYESPVLDGFPSTSNPVLMFADYGLIIYTSDDGKVYNHQTDELMRADGIIKVGIPTTTKRIKICFKDDIMIAPEAHLVRVVDIPQGATAQILSDLNMTLNYGTLENNCFCYEKFPSMTLEEFMKERFGFSNAEEYEQMNGGDDVVWEDIYETAKDMYEFECENGSMASIYVRDFTFTHSSLSQLPSAYIKFADYAECSDTVFFKINGEYISAVPVIGGNYFYKYTPDMLIPYGTEEIRFRSTFKAEGYVDMMDRDLPYPLCSIVNVGSEKSPIGNWVQLDAPTDRELWYDLDGDGTMEYKEGNKVYMLNPSASQAGLLGSSYGKWVNLNNDEYIDAYEYGENNGFERGTIFIGNNTLYHKLEDACEIPTGVQIKPIDYDNDGKTDFIVQDSYGEKGITFRQDADGKWVPCKVRIWTPEEYEGLEIKVSMSTGGTGIPGMEDMFVGSSAPPKATFGGYDLVDLNGDGRTDFIDSGNGCYYLNVGADGLVEYSFGGQIMPRDLNGDGISDFLSFDAEALKLEAYLTQEDGTSKKVTMMSGLYCSGNIWCYDFDKDGDVDVLIPFDYTVTIDRDRHDNGASYLVMMENKGDGTFKRHENYIEGETYFTECLDIDADGNYEVIGYNNGLYTYEIHGLEVSTTAEMLWKEGTKTSLFADVDSDGKMELFSGNRMYAISGKVNSSPNAPSKPEYLYNEAEGTLQILWGAATDVEAAELDLTYALRIGTEKDKGNILFAHAQSDGTRRNLQGGNNGYSRTRTLNVSSWPSGTYYISVQAIDPNRRGSKFSNYAVFEKKSPATGFILSHKYYYAIGDTCTVCLQHQKEAGYTYKWNWDGGTLLDQNAEGTCYNVIFSDGGEKRISLQVFDTEGNIAGISEQILNVNQGNITMSEDNDTKMAIDLDCDGKMEIWRKGNENKFFEGDYKGNYTSLKYIYNTNLANFMSNPVYIVDKNRDGRPDIFSYSPSDYKTNGSFFLMNDGDKQMTMSEPIDFVIGNNASWLDVDNDGDLDQIHTRNIRSILVNNGDYDSFTTIPLNEDFPAYYNRAMDYNRDGLIDFMIRYNNQARIYINKGDYTFTWAETLEYYPDAVADLDGDGKLDFIIDYAGETHGHSWSGDRYDIYWGGDILDSVPAPNGSAFSGLKAVYDVDNNGCLDIISDVKVIYFYPDRSWEIEVFTYSFSYYEFIAYHRTNGELSLGDYKISGKVNEKPYAPTGLRASQNDKVVVIEWDHSNDEETPANLMRYNISIKYKGRNGEGAYFHSPLNETKDGVGYPVSMNLSSYGSSDDNPIEPTRSLLPSNRFTIPITSIAPGEYEVQVQGIDRWEEPSDFSEVFNLTVKESSLIDMPASGMVDDYITIKILGNTEQMVSFGADATIIREDKGNGYYTVSYSTPGTKTVAVGSLDSQDIYIYPRPEGAFTLPERIMKGAKVTVAAPNATMGAWNVRWEGNTYAINNDVCSSMEIMDENQVVIHFKQHGNYTVEHQIGGSYYMASTIADHRVSSPVITIVNTDEATGKHKVNWNTAVDDWMDVRSINVYKETSRYDVYELIASVPVEQGTYVDMNSMPAVKASRYRLSYVTGYGESESSVAHQSIHVMINRGIGNTWNLQWSKYEGIDVVSYRILGGVTPESLELIAEVSGNVSSYSDLQMDSKSQYYAVEIVQDEIKVTRNATTLTSRSNVVSTDEAFAVNFTEKIIIKVQDDLTELSIGQHSAVQLAAILYPANTTIQKVNWMIWEGDELATIDANGRLMLTGNAVGKLTVRACAVDGSDVYSEVNFNVVKTIDDVIEPISLDSAQQTAVIYDLMGRKVIDVDKIKIGIYIINGKKVVIK